MTLPEVEAPLVSVVMVTHGGGEVALDAVKALAEQPTYLYELIWRRQRVARRDGGQLDAFANAMRSSRTRATTCWVRSWVESGCGARERYLPSA